MAQRLAGQQKGEGFYCALPGCAPFPMDVGKGHHFHLFYAVRILHKLKTHVSWGFTDVIRQRLATQRQKIARRALIWINKTIAFCFDGRRQQRSARVPPATSGS
ncbi:hypothetical protein [Azotobacter salinestris]|uniref:hypothetical protein n=1 Tax=Azotobacter salinestris TaxID=69964 RepID=UPI001266A89A|nr:hypothetical protein [Azotobacter salinestris]